MQLLQIFRHLLFLLSKFISFCKTFVSLRTLVRQNSCLIRQKSYVWHCIQFSFVLASHNNTSQKHSNVEWRKTIQNSAMSCINLSEYWRSMTKCCRRKAKRTYWKEQATKLKCKPSEFYKTYMRFLTDRDKGNTNELSLSINGTISRDKYEVSYHLCEYFVTAHVWCLAIKNEVINEFIRLVIVLNLFQTYYLKWLFLSNIQVHWATILFSL